MNIFKIFLIIFFIIFSGISTAGTVSVNMNVTGKITTSPCTVDTNTVSHSIDLGKIYAHNITEGTGSPWKAFHLTLSRCPSNWTSATVTFSGNAASNDNYFANNGTSTGLVLQISNSEHNQSYGNGDTISQPVDPSRNVDYNLTARMFNPAGEVGEGDFNAAIQVNFTYQ